MLFSVCHPSPSRPASHDVSEVLLFVPSLGLLRAICSSGWIWRKIHQRRWLRDADLAPLLVELPQKRELFGIPPTSSSPEVNTRDPFKKADLLWSELKLPIFGWIMKGRRRAY